MGKVQQMSRAFQSIVRLRLLCIICLCFMPSLSLAINPPQKKLSAEVTTLAPVEHVEAIIDISYVDHRNHTTITTHFEGLFGRNSRMVSVNAEVVHVRSKYGEHDGCGHVLEWNIPERKPWIALVARGECNFQQKITNLYKNYNASAVIVYNNEDEELFIIQHTPMPVVTALITKRDGEFIADLFENGIVITMLITSKDIMVAEKADQEARALVIANSRIRRSRTVLAVSVLIITGITVFFLVLLVHAIRVLTMSKARKKSPRHDGQKTWPAGYTAA
jgi:hypothetical protein